MDILLTQVPQFILCLSLLIVLHEMGHFLPARWFKVRVEKFYLFFDPWFSLWKKKKGDTEYGIGWLPLGGYVKLSGMIDESMDRDQMAKPPQPWEFRSKPAWQRLIVMVGGVVVNLLLGLVIYSMVMFVWGRETLPLSSMVDGVHPSEQMKAYGFHEGDVILGGKGTASATMEGLMRDILLGDCREVLVRRDGREMSIALPDSVDQSILRSERTALFLPRRAFVVDTILPGGGAAASELRLADRIVAINGIPTPYFGDFQQVIKGHQGERVLLGVERSGGHLEIPVQVSDEGLIGAGATPLRTKKETFGFFASFPAGIQHGMAVLTGQARSMKLLGTKEGAKQVGGFWRILQLFGDWGDWQTFWNVTAFLSIVLAFMNILPIPALDGGHVMFLLYEMVAGKPAPEKVMEVAQLVGMVLVIGLLLLANGNDIIKGITGG